MCRILSNAVWAMTNLCRRYMIIDASAAARRPSGSSGRGKIMATFRLMSRLQQLAGRDEFVLEVSSYLVCSVCVCVHRISHTTSLGFPSLMLQVFFPIWLCRMCSHSTGLHSPALILHHLSIKDNEGFCHSTLPQCYSCFGILCNPCHMKQTSEFVK